MVPHRHDYALKFFESPGTPSKRSATRGYQPAYAFAPQPVPPEPEPPPQVVEAKLWATVARSLGAPDSMTDKSFKIKRMYTETLLQFERVRPWAAPPRDISLGSAGVLNALCRAGARGPGGPLEGAGWHASCNPLGLIHRISRFFGCCAGQVCAGSQWANIGRTINPPPTMTALSFIFKRNFTEALLGFERVGRLAARVCEGMACTDRRVSQALREAINSWKVLR